MPPPRPRLLVSARAARAGARPARARCCRARRRPAAAAGAMAMAGATRDVVGAFRYAPAAPVRGRAAARDRHRRRRAARPCARRAGGRVTFAGPGAGGRGLGVTVRCGALVATHLGLGRLAVRRGAPRRRGRRGSARSGRAGRLRLGARAAAERFGYVDPLAPAAATSARRRAWRPRPGAAPAARAGAAAPAARPRPPPGRVAPRPAPARGPGSSCSRPACRWAARAPLAPAPRAPRRRLPRER